MIYQSMSRILHCTLVAFLALACAHPGWSQSIFATVTGTVTDTSGAVLPGADVVAVHKTLGLKYATQSNAAGVFTLPELREGEYTVRVTSQGFKEFAAEGIILATRDVRRLDVRLELGTVTEVVEVTAQSGAIETERATISATRGRDELARLPISAVNMYYMFMSLPATTARGSTPSFAGSREDQFLMTIDGASINSGQVGALSNLAGQNETFQEMRVEMVNTTAEHSGLAHVMMASRTGNNDLHGEFFWNYHTPAFRAREFYAQERVSEVRHNYGFIASGPLFLPKIYDGRNRTFWSISGDTDGANNSVREMYTTVPLEPWRRGDFSGLGVQIRNPINGDIYTDGRIPQQFINPVSQKILDRFYPLPNEGDVNVFKSRNNLAVVRTDPDKVWHGTARLDHKISDADYAFISFHFHEVDVNSFDGSLPTTGGQIDQKRLNKMVSFAENHTFSPNLINQFRFSYAFNHNARRGVLMGREIVDYLGLQGLYPDLPDARGVTSISFLTGGFTGISQTAQRRPGFVNKNMNVQNDVSYFRGRHNFKMGIQLGFIGFEDLTIPLDTYGGARFNNTFSKVPGVSNSGHVWADFLFGVPTDVTRSMPRMADKRNHPNIDWYFLDEWKVNQKLTLNLGLRYEYHAPWRQDNGMISMFDFSNGGRIVVADEGMRQVSPFVPASYIPIVSASSVGLPADTLLFGDRNNFIPRVQAAYRPFNNSSTVFRAGYGLAYDMTPYAPSMGGVPFIVDEPRYTNPVSNPTVIFPVIFPASGSGTQSTISLPSSVNPKLVMPMTQQWSFSIGHERWNTAFEAMYTGTATRKMWYGYDLNAPLPDGNLYNTKPRPFPQYPGITYNTNGRSHIYNALMLKAHRRFANGPIFQVAYTWARDIGDDSGPEFWFDRSRERGPDQLTPNQRFTASVIYELPIGQGKKLWTGMPKAADYALGGWELAVTSYQQTGQHLTPQMTFPDPTGTKFTNSGRSNLSGYRPDVIGDPNNGPRTADQWFNTSAFVAPPIGRPGNAGRGIIVGPGTNVVHASVHKTFYLADRERGPRLTVGLLANNVFNHINYGNPSTNLSSSGVGQITSSGGGNRSNPGDLAAARSMRLRLRIEF